MTISANETYLHGVNFASRMKTHIPTEPFYLRILYGPAAADDIGVCIVDAVETNIVLSLPSDDVVRIEVTKPEDVIAVTTVTLTKPLEAADSAMDCVTVAWSENVVRGKDRAKYVEVRREIDKRLRLTELLDIEFV